MPFRPDDEWWSRQQLDHLMTTTQLDAAERKKLRLQARGKITYRVRIGLMPPASSLKCTRCDNRAQAYHHHMGYALENHLNVIPLCTICHAGAKHEHD